MNFYIGDVTCEHCECRTRFLAESRAHEKEDQWLMVGDVALEEPPTLRATCDYCSKTTRISVYVENGVIANFLRPNEAKVERGVNGWMQEKNQTLTQFKRTFHAPFAEQPYAPGDTVTHSTETWEVVEVYLKETTETDAAKRLEDTFMDAYWYEMKSQSGETKWLVVEDSPIRDNATLSIEKPGLVEGEAIHLVTDSLFKKELLSKDTVGQEWQVSIYQRLHGLQAVVQEKNGTVLLDIFAQNMDDLMHQLDEYLVES